MDEQMDLFSRDDNKTYQHDINAVSGENDRRKGRQAP
jgi:hypothetical protein